MFNVFVDGEYYKVEVESIGGTAVTVSPSVSTVAVSPPSSTAKVAERVEKEAKPGVTVEGTKLLAPMPGMIVKYLVRVGDKVKAGDVVLILEAMKMQNTIAAPVEGTIKAINFKPGDAVSKDDVLAVIG
jgi:biotin carboxyl carrier protein